MNILGGKTPRHVEFITFEVRIVMIVKVIATALNYLVSPILNNYSTCHGVTASISKPDRSVFLQLSLACRTKK